LSQKNSLVPYESGQINEEKFHDGLKRYGENGDLTYEEIYEQNYSWVMSKDEIANNQLELSVLTMYRSNGKSIAKVEITCVENVVLIGTIYVAVKKVDITKDDIKAFYSKIEEFTDKQIKVALEPWDELVMGSIRHDFEDISKEYKRIEISNSVIDESNTQLYTISDTDGYSNLRKTPGGEIIRKVYENETFEVLGDEDKHKKVKLEDGIIGYIHNSKVIINN
jgi:hypothetical protein